MCSSSRPSRPPLVIALAPGKNVLASVVRDAGPTVAVQDTVLRAWALKEAAFGRGGRRCRGNHREMRLSYRALLGGLSSILPACGHGYPHLSGSLSPGVVDRCHRGKQRRCEGPRSPHSPATGGRSHQGVEEPVEPPLRKRGFADHEAGVGRPPRSKLRRGFHLQVCRGHLGHWSRLKTHPPQCSRQLVLPRPSQCSPMHQALVTRAYSSTSSSVRKSSTPQAS